ncbi:hypothetical protein SLE2022_234820 [Rubroshorea leprosula]
MLQQKSRLIWLKASDANTRYFHRSIKGRWRRNQINSLLVNGVELTGVEELKDWAANYFRELFIEERWQRPLLDGVNFKSLAPTDMASLTKSFTEEEVRSAVWECDSAKAPGPNGFNFGFIKSGWEVLKTDILSYLEDFHQNGKLVRGSNASFIVLVPKAKNPQKIEEYRPISLIGCMYKILSKVLANRLSRVLEGIIGEQQSVFIRGRQLVDGVVVANEGFSMSRGLRQEDPLSLYLFLIIAEGLNDDTLMMGGATKDNVWTTKCIMRAFELASGLKINYGKSSFIGVNVDKAWEQRISYLLNCRVGSLPSRYFGIPLGDGGSTRFWSDTWVGGKELSNVFPRLFLLAADKNCTVQDMGEWTNGNWTWKLKWRR